MKVKTKVIKVDLLRGLTDKQKLAVQQLHERGILVIRVLKDEDIIIGIDATDNPRDSEGKNILNNTYLSYYKILAEL